MCYVSSTLTGDNFYSFTLAPIGYKVASVTLVASQCLKAISLLNAKRPSNLPKLGGNNMRRLALSFLFVIATLFIFMPTPKVKAVWSVKTYRVYWNCSCVISPPVCGQVGEWTYYCDGSSEGWGNRPNDPCTYYQMTVGEWCMQE
jgi:hypothetical protein